MCTVRTWFWKVLGSSMTKKLLYWSKSVAGSRNTIDLVFCPGWISILEAGLSAGSASHINMFPPFNIFSMSFTFSVLLCHLFLYILFPVCQPLSLSFPKHSVFSHTHSLCLSLSDSLSDLHPPEHDLEADWLQPAKQLCVVGLMPWQRRFG